MSKILIIGASVLQLPAIKKAKEMGLEVAVADYNPNAIGISYADKYFNVSTIDVEAICNIAREYQPDGIMTLATDMPMRSVAAATTLLGLPGISMATAIKATDKGEMIKAFKENNVESPWYFVIQDEMELRISKQFFSYPCIIKPTDNAGSRGVTLVHSEEELFTAYHYAKEHSRGGQVIVEEFLQGQEVSVEIMVVDSLVHVLAVTDKITTGAPHFVEMGHSQPSRLSSKDLLRVKDLAVRAVQAIGINCGPAHVEIMNTSRGPKMIELGARMGGDSITTHLVPLSTGIDMVKATIDIALNQEPDILPKWERGSAIVFFRGTPGIITSIHGEKEALMYNGVKCVEFTKNVGDRIVDIESSVDRVGYIIAQAQNGEDALNVCQEAQKCIVINSIL
ncbi:MAG: ATP-grasp domain-containing protein [Marinifilaceae bacterium]|nr:ATP-grasp domain-containing protein [Marinifilaceae bacterium]